MNYSLGCKKDPRDLRDIPMGLVLPAIPIPAAVDYTPGMTPVRDQGDEGTCVGFATVVGVKEYEDSKEYRRKIALSPRFLYSLCKKLDGSPDEEGTYPRVAMKVLLKYGVCPEAFWPYKPHQSDPHKPGADARAKQYRIKAYARLGGLDDMKRSLFINGPFLAGVTVYDSWFTAKVNKTGIIPMPSRKNSVSGGHAICIMGYNNAKKIFKFKNSWSSKWGDCGYGYLPYAYMQKYCSDAWSVTDLIVNPKVLVQARESVTARF